MEDYRFRLIEIEEEESEEEDEGSTEVESDWEDYDDTERDDEHFIPDGINVPIHLGIFSTGEFEGNADDFDDDDDDYDEEDDEDDGGDPDHGGDHEGEQLFPPVVRLRRDLNSIEGDDYEDEHDEEGDYEQEDEEGGNYEEEEVEEYIPVERTSPRVSNSFFLGGRLHGATGNDNGLMENSYRSESCEGKRGSQESDGGEIHGSICPICFEAWTSGGEHQICCLPCGHIYGLSCIKKWLQQSESSGKCPQCNNLCTFKDVRVLYASRLCAADEELHKRVRTLEAKCAYLEQKASPLTPDELIDQICTNPAAMQRLASVLAEMYQQPGSR